MSDLRKELLKTTKASCDTLWTDADDMIRSACDEAASLGQGSVIFDRNQARQIIQNSSILPSTTTYKTFTGHLRAYCIQNDLIFQRLSDDRAEVIWSY